MLRNLASVVLLLLGGIPVCVAGDYAVDEKGRRFRVRFDSSSGLQ